MNKGARSHPPKKKHANRPRPAPVSPLTDEERRERAKAEFRKALVHLSEAEKLSAWGEAPYACVHSAYYAMHHCAVAALLAAGGVGKAKDVPRSHEHVIEHFGKLVAGESGSLAGTARLLGRARTDRVDADYGLLPTSTSARASVLAADARNLIEACSARWPEITGP